MNLRYTEAHATFSSFVIQIFQQNKGAKISLEVKKHPDVVEYPFPLLYLNGKFGCWKITFSRWAPSSPSGDSRHLSQFLECVYY